MKIRLDRSTPFNLDATLCCGQTFRWDKLAGWWYGVVGERVFKVRQTEGFVEFENADASLVRNYFDLNDNLNRILSEISKDGHIKNAVDMFNGLRILRQDPWECLISYICATYKNISAIKQMLSNLSRRFGERICLDGNSFYTFPKPEKLAVASESELTECGLGYRAKYVHETASMVNEGLYDFERLTRTGYGDAKAQLLNAPGVGPKVADCILLFSLGKLEAFPVDVWMRRAILRHYNDHFTREFIAKIREKEALTRSDYEKLGSFGRSYFGQFAGYAQEYLYHYERTIH